MFGVGEVRYHTVRTYKPHRKRDELFTTPHTVHTRCMSKYVYARARTHAQSLESLSLIDAKTVPKNSCIILVGLLPGTRTDLQLLTKLVQIKIKCYRVQYRVPEYGSATVQYSDPTTVQ